MRSLPIGIQDFKTIRDGNMYFVDKSMLIGQMLDQNPCGVFLYTRPRRFGKSLNLSMIDAFFNIKYKGNTWFDDLEISEHHEYDAYRNAFPVISFDLRVDGASDFESFVRIYNDHLSRLFRGFNYLAESPKMDETSKSLFKKLGSSTKCVETMSNQ